MSIDYVIQHAAPTLAGIKTGNLFPCTFASTQDMVRDLREINRVLVPRGLRLLPLRRKDDRALLYLFRPADLSRDLAGQEARRLLREAGYGDEYAARRRFAAYQSCTANYCRRRAGGASLEGLTVSRLPQ